MRETLSAIIEALKGQPVVLALTLVSLALLAVMYMQVACPAPTSGAAWGGLKWTSPDDRRSSDGGFGQGVK